MRIVLAASATSIAIACAAWFLVALTAGETRNADVSGAAPASRAVVLDPVAAAPRESAARRRRPVAPSVRDDATDAPAPSPPPDSSGAASEARALLDATDRRRCDALVDLLRQGEPGVRRIEAMTLADDEFRRSVARLEPRRRGEPSAALRDGVAAALASGDASVRLFALRCAVACGDDADIEPTARTALADRSARVRVVAADALAARTAAGAATLGALRQAAWDEDSRVRRAALDALSGLDEDATTEDVLVRALSDADARVREAAARGLGRCARGDAVALRALDAARFDGDADVASAASRALVDLAGR